MERRLKSSHPHAFDSAFKPEREILTADYSDDADINTESQSRKVCTLKLNTVAPPSCRAVASGRRLVGGKGRGEVKFGTVDFKYLWRIERRCVSSAFLTFIE
jgi:hypothetical protein